MLNPAAVPPKTRRHLSFDPLIRQIHLRATQLPESRKGSEVLYSIADAAMSSIAMFSLKDGSLLAFQERRSDANMKNIFRISQVPSDTQMREILDPIEPDLNKANAHVLVNFLQYTEYGSDGSIRKRFSWVTDLTITSDNARLLVRGGRSRWKIENETFNTLKNQDYQFGHNFGHGQQNLSTNFAMLMMLAFLVDQAQELCCPLFQAVRKKRITLTESTLTTPTRPSSYGESRPAVKILVSYLAPGTAGARGGLAERDSKSINSIGRVISMTID